MLAVILSAGSASAAGSKSSISRGGLGFLFADTNNFSNPGRFSLMRGAAIQAMGTKDPGASTVAATPSFVAGNGRVGVGVYGEREGETLTDADQSTDSVGAGFGFNFAKGRVSLGFAMERSLEADPPHDGIYGAAITLHPRGKGFSVGAGGSTTLNAETEVRAAFVALGYAFNPVASFEAIATFNDINDTNDLTGSGFVTFSGQHVYFGGGVHYYKVAAEVEALGRLGVVLRKALDLSVFASKNFAAGEQVKYGGSLRVRF